MCSGTRKPTSPAMEAGEGSSYQNTAILLELASADDVTTFRRLVDDEQYPLGASALWYGPNGNGRLSLELRTPLMIAALYGSNDVVACILTSSPGEAARASDSDGATALHMAAAGGATSALAAAHLLLTAGASPDAVTNSGHRAGDLIPRSSQDKTLRVVLKSKSKSPSPSPSPSPTSSPTKKLEAKKEYPQDLTLPDLKSGIFSTDEFRMYSFKIKPCSRAYSHDWTECPFVHPGENARRRDPRRYSYSCVPCPEFRKGGACRKGDACEYAHGVFECWLHPAQYRTRLCKDEVGCARRICFFAHKPEEVRAVNPSAISVASGGGGLPPLSSPRGSPPSSLDLAAALFLMQQQPSSPAASWMSQPMATSPVQMPAQLPGSRLKSALGARELDFELELLGLEQYQSKLFDKVSNTGSPRTNWSNANPTGLSSPHAAAARNIPDYTDLLGSVDPSMLSQLHALSLKQNGDMSMMPSSQSISSGFDTNLPTSPMVTASTAFGMDHSMAKAIMNSRASAFAKRSQSFIDRGGRGSTARSLMSPANGPPSMLSDWGSPDGKLDWGVQGDELHKFRKSASFGYRSAQNGSPVGAPHASLANQDVSWVNSPVKDGRSTELFGQWPEHEQLVA